MSETKWTPGEWRTGRSDMVTLSGDEASPYYKNVYVDDPRGGTHQGCALPYIVGRGQGDEDECRANARLLAAAPDLYAALAAFDAWFRERNFPIGTPAHRVWQQATSAIAKARGE